MEIAMKETARLCSSKAKDKFTLIALLDDDSLTSRYHATNKPINELDENEKISQTIVVTKRNSCLESFRGIILAIVSGIFMSLTSVIAKKVNIFPGELGLVRFLCIAIFALPLAIHSRANFFTDRRILIMLLLRGILASFSVYFRFEAMQRLPLADANVLIFSSPVLVAVMARFILKERCSFYLVLSLILTMIGLTLVVKLPLIYSVGGSPEFSSTYRILGVVCGLTSAFFNASMFVVVRKINKNLHHTVILFHLGWTASIPSLIITAIFGNFKIPNPVTYEPWWLLVMGLFTLFGQYVLTIALQREHAGPVSIARAGSDIISSFVWQLIFFAEKPDGYSLSGGFMVILGGLVLNLSKWVVSLPETSPIKMKLKCLIF